MFQPEFINGLPNAVADRALELVPDLSRVCYGPGRDRRSQGKCEGQKAEFRSQEPRVRGREAGISEKSDLLYAPRRNRKPPPEA